jgi:hypothetical protein
MFAYAFLLAFFPGCCSQTDAPTDNFYTVLTPVMNEYTQYVNGDPNLTDAEKQLRMAEIDVLAGYILEAKRTP